MCVLSEIFSKNNELVAQLLVGLLLYASFKTLKIRDVAFRYEEDSIFDLYKEV